ncbi:MAG: hypothetical protein M3O36_06235 [Myxococcota bacterium]|nr:hypothetical protein [Myxococcota bacterium]
MSLNRGTEKHGSCPARADAMAVRTCLVGGVGLVGSPVLGHSCDGRATSCTKSDSAHAVSLHFWHVPMSV